jgi:TetR/AcrR family transcriptional regulator, transcriptional repressor of bet genes
MRSLKKKSPARAPVPRARNSHSRQRQRLIDACISALHIYGPSRTTVEKVVAIAKMSPGIVRFYFASKAAMLVASLQFLAAEFEEQLLVPVARLKTRPVTALELMVDLYLDAEIASPRKVSVWYAFWGEASSRQEYYDICGRIDEGFAALVHELMERLIVETAQPHLDAQGISLGLIGALEMLWQDFAFRSEADIDRPGAKRRCMAYLCSIFPGQFAAEAGLRAGAAGPAPGARRVAAWGYGNSRIFSLERELVFQEAWQLAGHVEQMANTGDFLAPDLGIERPLILRDAGELRALRNSCTEAPHSLVSEPCGHLNAIHCAIHGLHFDLKGKHLAGRGAADLTALDLRLVGELILVRTSTRAQPSRAEDPWAGLALPVGSKPAAPSTEMAVAADWKLLVEICLDAAASQEAITTGWSARRYARLAGSAEFRWQVRFVAPNHLIESRPDGFTITQVLPSAPGRSVLRSHHYTLCKEIRPAAAAAYLASRLRRQTRRANIDSAQSAQQGLTVFGYSAAQGAAVPEVRALREYLLARIPALSLERPPTDS